MPQDSSERLPVRYAGFIILVVVVVDTGQKVNTERLKLHKISHDVTHFVPKLIVPRIAIKWEQLHHLNASILSTQIVKHE